MKKDVERLAELFAGFEAAHGTHGEPNRDGLKWAIKSTAKTLRQKVTPELWSQHVAGKRPLGVIPIREDNTCLWGSIDFDEYDVDVQELIDAVKHSKLPLVPCRSKSGGLHLFLFLEAPEPAEAVQNALRDAAASLGLGSSEIFPKQTRVLLDRGDLGNWMVMPYFGSTFDGKLQWQRGVRPNGSEMTLGEFVAAAEKARTTTAAFLELSTVRTIPKGKANGAAKSSAGRSRGKSPCDFSDGPPCLQHLAAKGKMTDERKRVMFMHALYLKRADPEGWRERLEQSNQTHCSPPLPASEIQSIINSCEKKDYEYKCKEEPFLSHCNSGTCRARKFGVGSAGGEYPEVTGLTKMDSDPPLWFLDVSGVRIEVCTEDLLSYRRFLRKAVEKTNRVYKLLKDDVWLGIINEAMMKMEQPIEAPPEASTAGVLHGALEEFLCNRATGERLEDLCSGRPWHDVENNRRYFRGRDFRSFLQREGYKNFEMNWVYARVRELGGSKKEMNLRGKNLAQQKLTAWWVPADKLQEMIEFDPVEKKEEESPI